LPPHSATDEFVLIIAKGVGMQQQKMKKNAKHISAANKITFDVHKHKWHRKKSYVAGIVANK
jgi:hypothetical protein